MEGFKNRTFKNLIKNTGSAKIYQKGYYEKEEILPLDKNIGEYEKLAQEIKKLYPEVKLAPQIKIFAYLNYKNENLIAYGMGIKPYTEKPPPEISPLYQSTKDYTTYGRFFKNNKDRGIIVNKFCAEKLNLKLKDKVIILTTDIYNSFNMIEMEVIGILERTLLPIENKSFFLIDLISAQKLLGLEGKVVELIATFSHNENIDEFKKTTDKIMKKYHLEIITYKEILGVFYQVINLAEVFMVIIYFIFILISSVGITNTVLISTFERLRDIGMLRAIGLTRQGIFKIALIELGALGFISSLIGILISIPIIYYFSVNGIYIWHTAKDIAPWIDKYIYLDFSYSRMFTTFIIGSIIPVIAGIYPLIITSKMQIRELLGWV